MNIFEKALDTVSKSVLGFGHSVASLPWLTPGKWSKKQQLQQFNRYVYTIVSAFAIDFAKSEIKVQRKLNEKWQDQPSHDFTKLLESPNPLQSGFQFLELHATYMKLAGESFWYIAKNANGTPKELYLMRPDLVEVEVNRDTIGTIKGYVLHKEGGEKQKLDPDEVVHHKYPNPVNPYRGMGVVEAAMTYLQTEEFSSDWTKNSIYNSGRPSGILNLKGKMKDDQFEQLKSRFKQEYTGTKNAGKTLLLKGFDGIDWAKLGVDLEGIDLERVKKVTREDIMFMFRTSNTIMGITDDVNRANSKEMRGVWMENVVKPELIRITDQLNHSFAKPILGDDYKFAFTDPNPETVADRLDEWKAGVDKWLTKNQIIRERNELLGTDTPEIEGGDNIWQPFSLVPMDQSEMDEEPEEAEERSLSTELSTKQEQVEKSPACRMDGESRDECMQRKIPEIVAENPNIGLEQAVAIAAGVCDVPCESEEAKDKHVKEMTKAERGEVMRKNLFREQQQWEQPYRERVNRVFEKQQAQILERFKDVGDIKEKQLEEWLFDKLESSAIWKNTLLPITAEILIEQSRHMFEFVDDDTVEGVLEITPAIRREIEDRIERFTGDVDDQTRAEIIETITEGISEGESLSKLQDRIESVYNYASTTRSERIARTETIFTSNKAQQLALKQIPSVAGQEWLANPGACEFCSAVNGKIVGLNENFFNQGQSVEGQDGGVHILDYTDVGHPPLHVNCRCTLLPVNAQEMRSFLESRYNQLDGRTKEAKAIREQIENL